VRAAGHLILKEGGVVRGLTNWGTFYLPKPTRRQGITHAEGHYFILRFDSSPKTQHTVRKILKLDPRMIRFSVVGMGSTLEEIKDLTGHADFMGKRAWTGGDASGVD
jgi:small subunit ribosomal protein S6